MAKVLPLLIMILLTIASATGSLVLDKIISAGEIRMAEGQRQLEEGQSSMEEGKVALLAGKRELSEGKEKYAEAEDSLFLKWADKLLHSGKGFKEGREQIAEGERQVADGEKKVDAGEDRLHAGELKLSRGRERLRLAKKVRIACAIGAGVSASLAIVFGFRWRRSLARVTTHSPT